LNTAACAERSAWATALIPVVLHELNNATQFLGMLHSAASEDPEGGMLERCAPDLGDTAASVEDLGLLLAILSTAAGTDLLLQRRSERGVLVVARATTKWIRKTGRDLRVRGLEDPLVRHARGQGWELPWAFGASCWIAAMELTEGQPLELYCDATGWGSDAGGCERMRAHVLAVGESLSEVQGETSGTAWKFTVPEGWLVSGEGSTPPSNA
jgi:hypothetical protein